MGEKERALTYDTVRERTRKSERKRTCFKMLAIRMFQNANPCGKRTYAMCVHLTFSEVPTNILNRGVVHVLGVQPGGGTILTIPYVCAVRAIS